MRSLTTLLIASPLLLSGATVPSTAHLAAFTGNWKEHSSPDTFVTLSPRRLLVNDHTRLYAFNVQQVTEGSDAVVLATTLNDVPHEWRLQPIGTDKAAFAFDGDRQPVDRLAPKGKGVSDKIRGTWTLAASTGHPGHAETLTITEDQVIGAEDGKIEKTSDLSVIGETADTLTVQDDTGIVTYKLKGKTLEMRIKGHDKVVTFVRS